MQAFEAQGVWWLPESPENQVYGSLSCSDDGELRVSLLGHLLGSWGGGRRECPALFGVIRKGAVSTEVTLSDCIVTNTTFSSGLAGNAEELFAHRGYFGAHVPTESGWTFSRANVSYSRLSSWASSFSGFSSTGPSFSETWKAPEPIVGEVGGGTLLLGVGCTTSGTARERRLAENVGLTLSFEPPIRVAGIEAEYISPLQDFFTFATDTANAVSRLAITPSQTYDSLDVIGSRTFSDDDDADDLIDSKMLFTLNDVSDRLPALLKTWLELHKRYSAAFSVYFSGLYRPPGYTDLRFLLLMQTVTLYVAARRDRPSDAGSKALLSDFTGESRDHISDLLATHPLLTGKQAVEVLLASAGDIFTPLLGKAGDRREEEFLKYVTATHRYTITRQPPVNRFARDGADLYWLCERLGFLFKISLLRDLGFTTDIMRNVLPRNRIYTHLRDSFKSLNG